MRATLAVKQAKAFTPMTKLLPVLVFVFLLSSCGSDELQPRMPEVPVNEQINTNSLQYPRLRQDGGYAYLNAGYKGIIVVRQTANLFLAFEQACPYDPTAFSCKVEVDQSNLFLIDKCCGSQFNFQGSVTAGPAVYGLKQYRTSLAGSVLYISN